MKQLLLLISFIAGLSSALCGFVASNSQTRRTYASVQEAIDAARNGYTVYVYTDVSEEILLEGKQDVRITRSPTALSRPSIRGEGRGIGITVSNAKDISIEHIRVTGWEQGVHIAASSNVRFTHGEVVENEEGVIVRSSHTTLSINNIQSNSGTNLFVATNVFAHAMSNYFGSRRFSAMRVAGARSNVLPWSLHPFDFDGIIVIPPGPLETEADFEGEGQVLVSWKKVDVQNFAYYTLYRTRASAPSEIDTSHSVKRIYAIENTTYHDLLIVQGTYYYFVTVTDIEGNESWYSPATERVVFRPLPRWRKGKWFVYTLAFRTGEGSLFALQNEIATLDRLVFGGFSIGLPVRAFSGEYDKTPMTIDARLGLYVRPFTLPKRNTLAIRAHFALSTAVNVYDFSLWRRGVGVDAVLTLSSLGTHPFFQRIPFLDGLRLMLTLTYWPGYSGLEEEAKYLPSHEALLTAPPSQEPGWTFGISVDLLEVALW